MPPDGERPAKRTDAAVQWLVAVRGVLDNVLGNCVSMELAISALGAGTVERAGAFLVQHGVDQPTASRVWHAMKLLPPPPGVLAELMPPRVLAAALEDAWPGAAVGAPAVRPSPLPWGDFPPPTGTQSSMGIGAEAHAAGGTPSDEAGWLAREVEERHQAAQREAAQQVAAAAQREAAQREATQREYDDTVAEAEAYVQRQVSIPDTVGVPR